MTRSIGLPLGLSLGVLAGFILAAALLGTAPASSASPRLDSRPAAEPSYDVSGFSPIGTSTAWAVTNGNVGGNAPQAVVRTVDGGGRWSDVTPAEVGRPTRTNGLDGVDALSATRAWLTYGGPRRQTIDTTSDGGRRWVRTGQAPSGCQLDFVSARDGWCVSTDGAAGSEAVFVYRTVDGGAAWREVSHTNVPSRGSSPGALPFGCDKSLTFAAPATGFASAFCVGGRAFVDRSSDGGARWTRVLTSPVDDDGAGFGPVVASGDDAAAGYLPDGRRGPVAAGIEDSTDGGVRWTLVRAPTGVAASAFDVVTPTVWKLTDGRTIETTTNAGRSWTRVRSNVSLLHAEAPLFTTADVGWFETGLTTVLHTTDGGRDWTRLVVPER